MSSANTPLALPRSNQTSRPRTLARRLVTVPAMLVAAVVVVVTLPVTLLLAALVDVVFRRWEFGTVRIVLFVAWYLAIAVIVQVWGLWVWLATRFGTRSQTHDAMIVQYRTIAWWIRCMLGGLRVFIGLRMDVDHPELIRGPAVIASRHTSLADVFVPTGLALLGHGTWIRVVLTSGLVNEPSLDLFGHRTPQHFIERGSKNMQKEVDALHALGANMDENTALIIFPEGGLYRPDRLEKVVASLEAKDPAQAERARRLRHVLPPKPAGFNALLDGAPSADVVIVGHTGFERLTTGRTIWKSVPLREPSKLRVTRHDRLTVPDDEIERREWLNDRWEEMDRWIHESQSSTPIP